MDPDAGHFSIRPRDAFESERRYLPGTLVLETTFTTSSGRVVLLDALDFERGKGGTNTHGCVDQPSYRGSVLGPAFRASEDDLSRAIDREISAKLASILTEVQVGDASCSKHPGVAPDHLGMEIRTYPACAAQPEGPVGRTITVAREEKGDVHPRSQPF